MLRADPDVIMVGEIRDGETAKIAIESALTGHLVLSTLHTNDAPSAITRLTEMGIEPFLTASAVCTVVAQRLVRQLCTHCKSHTTLSVSSLERAGFSVPSTSTPTSRSAATAAATPATRAAPASTRSCRSRTRSET